MRWFMVIVLILLVACQGAAPPVEPPAEPVIAEPEPNDEPPPPVVVQPPGGEEPPGEDKPEPEPEPKPEPSKPPGSSKPGQPSDPPRNSEDKDFIDLIEDKFGSHKPKEWGERVTGVITRIDTREKVIALTFDACGATGLSAGFDRELIDFLVEENIPATMFLSGQWLQANWNIAVELAANPLFSIQNHGYRHRPLSVNGKSVYGIQGTASVREVVEEIHLNDQLIQELTGKVPAYYRSGTAYYDEVAVMIAHELGKEVVNFNVLGDAGATFNKAQIASALLGAKPGSIILYHMNRPESDIAEALIETLPKLIKNGFTFVKLEDYHNKLR